MLSQIKTELKKLKEEILEQKEILICVGKEKKPKDSDDVIIFHVDI